MDTRTDLAAELLGTVGRFRRQARRSGGAPRIGTGLPESHAELLRLVGRQPGISVREAATELGLAANTASTLVSRLSGDGLLVRTVDPDDRRVGRLRLTEPAQRLADESRAVRRAALRTALDRLDAEQRDRLGDGIAVLAELTRLLREEDDA
ncbi:MarR family transcriptional regulator [Mycolicibacterium madagascariense]|uniref:MarR family transcriptional regulator n=1 Tax=Mycolicibacterium madagascariense TaxID=212765 RepID=A0A7I7XP13_9MYCO|nr:MarR family transcriptional regulator [Mycolicibacterium madagascariense]MCV7011962.1 MarR family transcriptional regulator [Mycolicibacterium madagascariense]BBZ30966.1 MarR family transcriptional regulator [Mycolicibacterium madagascariense]